MLFSSLPVRSHLEPLLPTALAARAAGHDVAVVTGPDAASFVEAAGLHVIAEVPTMAENLTIVQRMIAHRPRLDDPEVRRRSLVHDGLVRGVAAENVAVLSRLIDAYHADMVVSTLAEYASTIASARSSVPNVVHGFGLQPTAEDREQLLEALSDAAASAGVPDPSAAFSSATYIDIWPKGLAGKEPLFEAPLYQRPEHAMMPGKQAQEADTIYVTFGTTHRGTDAYVDGMVDGALSSGFRVVVTAGAAADSLRARRSHPRLTIHEYLPQQEILRRSIAVIHHGGSGTAIAALSAGVPSLVAPVSSDHHLVAEALQRGGVGLALDPSPHDLADRVASAVAELHGNRAYRARSRAFAKVVDQMPTPASTVAALTEAA